MLRPFGFCCVPLLYGHVLRATRTNGNVSEPGDIGIGPGKSFLFNSSKALESTHSEIGREIGFCCVPRAVCWCSFSGMRHAIVDDA
jgi:ATP-dependent protease HslVU (ClpYQ) peptidase subunit